MDSTGGMSVSCTFDILDRVTDIAWKDASNNVVRGFGYSYNNVGMITQKETAINGQQTTNIYTYDSLDRLTSESSETSEGTHQTTWTYDLAGNRLNQSVDGTNTAYTVGLGNRLTAWGMEGTNSLMKYDNAGNVTSIYYNSSSQLALKWDSRRRVTEARTNGIVTESYQYDALDRRISISDGVTTNYLVYAGVHVIAEVGTSGSLVRSYTYGSPSTGSGQAGIDNILAMTVYGGTTQTYYYVKDHLGSVQAIVDASGSIVESYQYDAWGNTSVFDGSGNSISQSAIGNRYLWNGREYSFKTKLYYFRARYYDSETGRWLSNDPIGISGGLNQYVFCGNNPVNLTDPLGLAWIIINANARTYGSGTSESAGSSTGHGWVTIVYDNGTSVTIGNYPRGPDTRRDVGIIPNASHGWYTTDDKAAAAQDAVSWPGYDFFTDNCVDRVEDALDAAGIPHPNFNTFGVSDPNNLANWLRSLNR